MTYGVISITELGRGNNVIIIYYLSSVSNVISSVNINNEEIIKVYIGYKNRIFKESIEKLTYKCTKIYILNNDILEPFK